MKAKYSCHACHKRGPCECPPPDYDAMRRGSDHAPSIHVHIAALRRAYEHRTMMREVEENRREETRDTRRERRG